MGTRFSNLFFIRIYISLNNFICITNMKFLCISNIFSPWLLDTRIKIIKLIDCWMEAYISLTAPSLVAQCHITHMYWFFFLPFLSISQIHSSWLDLKSSYVRYCLPSATRLYFSSKFWLCLFPMSFLHWVWQTLI